MGTVELAYPARHRHEGQRHAKRLAEEFGVVSIAEPTDHVDGAPTSVAGMVTTPLVSSDVRDGRLPPKEACKGRCQRRVKLAARSDSSTDR